MHRRTKLRLADLNPCLTCRLCGGYYVDACTIQECLHSFCKSCIVRYLETKKNCPVCRVLIHKTRPLENVRPDPTLQDVVYKLVPGMLKNEMMRRRRFYADNPCFGPAGNPTWSEDRGDIIDPERAIFMEDDKISIALTHSPDGVPITDLANGASATASAAAGQPTLGTTYLFCPAMVTIGVLKKFIRCKYELSPDDDLIAIFQSDESLSEDYTLMDIVYLYTWRRQGPLRLFFTIYKFRPVVKRPSLSVPAAPDAQHLTAPPPAAATGSAATTQDEPLNMSKKRKIEQVVAGLHDAGSGSSSVLEQPETSRRSQGGGAEQPPTSCRTPQLVQRQASVSAVSMYVSPPAAASAAAGEQQQQLPPSQSTQQPLRAAASAAHSGCDVAAVPVAGRLPRVAVPAVGSSSSSGGSGGVEQPPRMPSQGSAASLVAAVAAAASSSLAGQKKAIPVNALLGVRSSGRGSPSLSSTGSSSTSSSSSACSGMPESSCLDANDNGVARAAFSDVSGTGCGVRTTVKKSTDEGDAGAGSGSSALNLCISKR